MLYSIYQLTLDSRLIYALMKEYDKTLSCVPSFSKVSPESYHATAELSIFVVVLVVTKRNSEHVLDLVCVEGIANPLWKSADRTAMVVCVHVQLVFNTSSTCRRLFKTMSHLQTRNTVFRRTECIVNLLKLELLFSQSSVQYESIQITNMITFTS